MSVVYSADVTVSVTKGYETDESARCRQRRVRCSDFMAKRRC